MDTHGGRDARPNNVWPDMWKRMSDASKRKGKQKWAIEKPKLEKAKRLRGIFFIDPDDDEFKRAMIHARRKLEIPTPQQQCLVDFNFISTGETCCTIGQHKTKYACVVEADAFYEDTHGRVSEQEP